MTILIFKSGRHTVATENWTVAEYHSYAAVSKPKIGIHVLQRIVDPVYIDISIDEFMTIVADSGKVVDLRKLQGIS